MKAGIYGRNTITDLILTAVETYPGRGVGFVQPDGTIDFITYPDILAKSLKITAGLQDAGLAKGSEVMIVTSKNETIITSLWGCILGGYIPTILQPPVSFTEFNQPAQKIENVFRILRDPRVIISRDFAGHFHSPAIPEDKIFILENLVESTSEPMVMRPDEHDVAYVQFSSGSTGDPKGVVLSHKNILTNLAAIGVGLDIHTEDIFVNWMPLYHDMGLFGYHLCPLFAQLDQYLIEPVDFVKRPAIWLDVMDQVRCTITGCPNFGQALLLRYLKNRETRSWDLSSVKGIVNGAEPISGRIMTEFLDKLAVHKLRRGAMMPAYGMAEATLAISFSPLLSDPLITKFNRTVLVEEGIASVETEKESEMIEIVSVGKALPDNEIRIVNEKNAILDEGVEGQILIRGAGITSGYYNNLQETRNAITDGWLKTGDKGFFYKGNLYITGRIKDIIFVRGQNLYAHDLEDLASKYSDIPFGKVIIGGVFNPKKGKDQLLMFLVGSPNEATCDTFLSLRKFFRDTYGIHFDVFIPIRSNQVPKTSSGKIQRFKLVAGFQAGEFDGAIRETETLINAKGEQSRFKSVSGERI